MGQRLSACCPCLAGLAGDHPKRGYAASIQPAKADVQQPLVVEDESWKKWSSYHLLHAKDPSKDDQYNPPVFVSQSSQQLPPSSQQQQQHQHQHQHEQQPLQYQHQQHHQPSAEAVWDL